MKKLSVLLFLILSLLLAQTAGANMMDTNIVVNGGFEAGVMDWTGWTLTGPTDYVYVNDAANSAGAYTPPYPLTPHWGTYEAQFGAVGDNIASNYCYLSQTLNTAPSQSYYLKFWLANDSDPSEGSPNHFAASWNGVPLSGMPLDNVNASAYTEYSYTVTATGSSTVLEFEFLNNNGYFYLDDVSAKPVPAPATILLLGSGLVGLVGWRKYRQG